MNLLTISRHAFRTKIDHLNDIRDTGPASRLTLYKNISQQLVEIRSDQFSRRENGDPIHDVHERNLLLFKAIENETGAVKRKHRNRNDDDADHWDNFIKKMGQGDKAIGDWQYVSAIYYWFHLTEDRASYAAAIDDAVFEEPFHNRFRLTRDQYWFPDKNVRDFEIGPLRFSTSNEAASLSISTVPTKSILDAGYPSPSRALSWQYDLTDRIGRQSDYSDLIDWARSGPGEVRLRLLSGVGGSGKSRLASELASELAADGNDWNAGFLGRGTEENITIAAPGEGVFIIIDYPEERMAFVESVILSLADKSSARVSVRVLLLSRLDESHWEHASRALGHRYSVQSPSATDPLHFKEAKSLIEEAFKTIADLTESSPAQPEGVEAWLQADPMHRLPLFATAAALHAFLAPQDAFGLNGAEVVEALALIERDRVRAYSQSVGLGEYGLERLLALATFSKTGLSQSTIETLGGEGLPVGQSGQSLIDALGKTPWWKPGFGIEGSILEPLSPDRMAVAFLALTLLNTKLTNLPRWLGVVLSSAGSDVGALLSRLLFDLSIHDHRYGEAMEQLSLEMLDASETAFQSFREAAYSEQTVLTASFAVKVIERLLDETTSPMDRAGLLHNLGTHFHHLNRLSDATAAYEECIKLRRKATRFPWPKTDDLRTLALSLNNYANCLSEIGEKKKANLVADEALRIREKLAKGDDKEALREVAVSLSNQSNTLAENGRHQDALVKAQQAVETCRKLVVPNRLYSVPELARALHNCANAYARLGHLDHALACLDEAISYRRKLAETKPDKHEADLGGTLSNRSKMLLLVGRADDALDAAREAIRLFKKMARMKPEVYGPALARSYFNAANAQVMMGKLEQARDDAKLSWETFGVPTKSEPADVIVDRAETAVLLAHCEMELTDALAALNVLQSSIEALSEAGIDGNNAQIVLARSYAMMSEVLEAIDDIENAARAAEQTVLIYSALAKDGDTTVEPYLAFFVYRLSGYFQKLGHAARALEASTSAVAIYGHLAALDSDSYQTEKSEALGQHALCMVAVGSNNAAKRACEKALWNLMPPLMIDPQRHYGQVCELGSAYVSCCENLGVEPDEVIMSRLSTIFQNLPMPEAGKDFFEEKNT